MPTMLNNVLHIALGKYADLGFTLTEHADEYLALWHNGELIDRFTQRATFEALQNACQDHLNKYHEGG